MKDHYSDRKYIIGAMMVLPVLFFLVRLFILQVLDPSYKLSASSNVLRNVTQYPSRGLIYDRNGELLVYNEPAYDLMVVPAQLAPFDTVEFCTILEISKEYVDNEIARAREYSRFRSSVFLKQISARTYAVLQEKLYKYPGFYVQPRTLRKYSNDIAAHVLGYVGEVDRRMIAENPGYVMGDYIGITGVEKTYEEVLRGQKGVNVFLVDVHNRVMGSYQEGRFNVPAVVGNDLTLSLDASLQAYGEKLMRNKVGSVVAIEPSTGEILSLVSTPTYNPELLVGRVRTGNFRQLSSDTLNPLFNRALMAHYPAGSTFKVVNGLVALQEGIIDDVISHTCPGHYSVGRLTVRCRHHVSPVAMAAAIQVSCNTYFCHIFRDLLDHPKYGSVTAGFNVWHNHLRSFGLGEKLETDFPNELRGFVPPATYYDRFYGENRWRSLQVVSLALGQGELSVTPIQMANISAIIANRGFYITPHILKDVAGSYIDPIYRDKLYTTIDSVNFEPVIEGMYRAVNGPEGGTARIAQVPGLDICGKTGTAENPHGDDHSVFIAFAPRDNPQIAIAVYVENAGFGAAMAAPIASLMIEKYLNGEIAANRRWLEQRMLEADFINRLVASTDEQEQ
ncbi:MAG: penicillin-binding protein 2 [Marinilabiliales bacterium]|nr:MAG: penicillin-binding protein 2 [Marinilabiliales bacterium]